jgi:hypothetical protein
MNRSFGMTLWVRCRGGRGACSIATSDCRMARRSWPCWPNSCGRSPGGDTTRASVAHRAALALAVIQRHTLALILLHSAECASAIHTHPHSPVSLETGILAPYPCSRPSPPRSKTCSICSTCSAGSGLMGGGVSVEGPDALLLDQLSVRCSGGNDDPVALLRLSRPI